MEHRTKRNHSLINLVSSFEDMSQKGRLSYLDEQSIQQLLNYYENENQIAKAIEVVDHALEQFKFRSEFYTHKARLLLRSHKSEKALQLLDTAENIAPLENDIRILRARVLSELDQFDEAIEILDNVKSVATKSDLPDIFLCESYINENLRDYTAMFNSLKKVLKLEPFNEEALERIWIAVELSRKYPESINLHHQIINSDPYSYLAWFNLGHAYACIGEYEDAIQALEYAFIINEEFEVAYLDCAEICCQLKLYNKAISLYSEANKLFGPDAEILVNIADCLIKLKRFDESKVILKEAVQLDPYNDEIYFFLAECYVHERRWVKAIGAYNKAISIEDGREEYFSGLAFAYIEIGQLDKAQIYFRRATEVAPEESHYWLHLVSFLIKRGKTDLAINILDEAELYTFSPGLIYCRAICLLLNENRKEAFNVLEEALLENFGMHKVIFELAPQFNDDTDVKSIINYYKGEVPILENR